MTSVVVTDADVDDEGTGAGVVVVDGDEGETVVVGAEVVGALVGTTVGEDVSPEFNLLFLKIWFLSGGEVGLRGTE